MQARIEEVRAKVKECVATAEKLFNIKLPSLEVRFDLKGRAAGQVGGKIVNGVKFLHVRFNRDHIRVGGQSYQHLLTNTVPHEIAHIVCLAFPRLGTNHNRGWQRVCISLGGNGQTYFNEDDAPEAVALLRPYVYITTLGHEVRVTKIIHNKIQKGESYLIRGGKGKLTSSCKFNYMVAPTVKPA